MKNASSFDQRFAQLTGNVPFPWQQRLYDLMVQGPAAIPDQCDIPTGLGKTSIIALWLLAREMNASLPRRLVYVVNRRTVVDQTTAEVEKYKALRSELTISTLRGQYQDNREWSADPSRQAVICGTVDMIGSRMLFSGYGVGYKGKPLHAGFLGRDVLVVHDEAHLEPAFQALLKGIEAEQQRCASEKGRFQVMELSATARKQNVAEIRHAAFGLTSADRTHPEVARRINATKQLILTPQSADKLGHQLAATAIDRFKDSGRPILIFVRLVEDLKLVLDRLRSAKLQPVQLTGTMRGRERERLLKDPRFVRFLPLSNRPKDVNPADGTVFLVCTSAGEVGVNLSADHLVCDLSTFESMAQRFGRVNRFGLHNDTEIHVIHPKPAEPKDEDNDPPEPQRRATLKLLRRLDGDASPDALAQLDPADRAAAFAPPPTILPTTDILFDAWSLTSIRDRMPGRPQVEPYLHGVREWEPPETHVAWREEVGTVTGDLLTEYPPEDLLDEYPLKPHELLRDRTHRVLNELVKLAGRYPDSPVWIVDDQGHVQTRRIGELAELDRKQADTQLGGMTVLLPHDVGGLASEGTLDGDQPPTPRPGETPTPINIDVADAMRDPAGRPLRQRIWKEGDDDGSFATKSKGMRRILCIDFPSPDDDQETAKRSWHWFELPLPKENSRNAPDPVLLVTHVADVVARATRIASNLVFDPDPAADAAIRQAILLAALFHDLGKMRDGWQRSIGRPAALADVWFGKSGRRWKPRQTTEYRHEFGSLVDLQSKPEFASLDADAKDLVQHLIAAHHGQARPHFAMAQIIDPNHRTADCEQLAVEVPRRFARLQRRFGRWGLAYLESILRAADWHASAEPSAFFTEDAR